MPRSLWTCRTTVKRTDFRRALGDMSPAMIGTVPMYDAVWLPEKTPGNITAQDFLTSCVQMPKKAGLRDYSRRPQPQEHRYAIRGNAAA